MQKQQPHYHTILVAHKFRIPDASQLVYCIVSKFQIDYMQWRSRPSHVPKAVAPKIHMWVTYCIAAGCTVSRKPACSIHQSCSHSWKSARRCAVRHRPRIVRRTPRLEQHAPLAASRQSDTVLTRNCRGPQACTSVRVVYPLTPIKGGLEETVSESHAQM